MYLAPSVKKARLEWDEDDVVIKYIQQAQPPYNINLKSASP